MSRFPFLLVFFAFVSSACLAQSGDSVFEQSYPFEAGEDLSIATSSSDVFVRAGSGSEARVEVFGKGRDLDEAFRRLNFSVERRGGELVVKTDPENNWFSSNRASFDVVVTAPERLDLSVATSSGDVAFRTIQGDVQVSTSSGDLEFDTVRGPVAVSTSSGDVEGSTVEGAAEFSTSSGDVEVDRIRGASVAVSTSSGDFEADRVDADTFEAGTSSGDVSVGTVIGRATFSTSSGDVEIGTLEGGLTASTSSGDVEARLAKPGPVEISTGSGGVELSAPASLAADVDFRGGSVRIDRAFQLAGTVERRRAEGQIGGGGESLKVHTGSGSITLARR